MDMILFLILITICFVDIKSKIIPDIFVLFVLIILCTITDEIIVSLKVLFITLFILNILYFALKIIYGKVMLGYGDVKLLSVISIDPRIDIFELILTSFLLSSIYVFVLFLIKKRISPEKEIPFAPFIVIAYYICLWEKYF